MAAAAAAGRICCCYHFPCHDGVFAALAVHLHHAVLRGEAVDFFPNTTYAPLSVDDLGLRGDELVYLADFSGPPGFAVSLAASARRVIVLDHHKTAAEDLASPAVAATPNLEVGVGGRAGGCGWAAPALRSPPPRRSLKPRWQRVCRCSAPLSRARPEQSAAAAAAAAGGV